MSALALTLGGLAEPIFRTLLNGISWGVMLILIAVGFTIVFGFLGVVNFAHGAFYMAGGYVLFATVDYTGSFALGLVAAIAVVGMGGGLTELSVLRPTYDIDPIIQVIFTLGITLIIEGILLLVYGGAGKNVNSPTIMSGSISLGGFSYPKYRFLVMLLGIALIAGIWLILRYSQIGLAIRASLTDKEMVNALGYNIPRLYTFVFAIAMGFTGFVGALMTPMNGVDPATGGSILITAVIVVVIGGLGSFRGSIVAGLMIGIVEMFVARFAALRWAPVMSVVLLLVVLLIKPNGLFGEEGVLEG